MSRLLALLVLGNLALLACTSRPPDEAASSKRQPGPPHETEARSVPEVDLEGAEDEVIAQITAQQESVRQKLAASGVEDGELAEAYGDLGLLYITYDFLDAASRCLALAQGLEPEDFRWPYLLGYLEQSEGRHAAAVPLFRHSLELQDSFSVARLRLARSHLELGEPEAAEALFSQVLAGEARSAPALEGLGRSRYAARDYESAARYLEEALALSPQSNSLHYVLGQTYRHLGDLDRASAHFEESGDVAVAIADPLISPLAQRGRGAQFYLVQGGEALKDGHYEGAVAAYRRALEQDPTSFVAYKALAYSLEKLGDLDAAVAELREALERGAEVDPAAQRRQEADVHRVLAGLLVLDGKDLEAIDHLHACLELDSRQPAARLKLANALARQRRFHEALEHYDRLVEESPEHASVILEKRAIALVNLGRGDEAVAAFGAALEAAPDDARLRQRFAQALDHLGRHQEAERVRRELQAMNDSGSRADLLASEARSKLARGDVGETLRLLEEALAVAPDRQDLRFELATVLGHSGRYEAAIAAFEEVIAAEPRHRAARRGQIVALLLDGRYAWARQRIQESLKLFPRDAALAHVQARLVASSPDARVRDGAFGVALAERLVADHADDLEMRATLAMALAESGEFDRAIELQDSLRAEALERGHEALASSLEAQLREYREGRAWTAASGEEILAATLGPRERSGS